MLLNFGDISFGYAQTSFGDKAVTSAYGQLETLQTMTQQQSA